jgi:hypothetical protein
LRREAEAIFEERQHSVRVVEEDLDPTDLSLGREVPPVRATFVIEPGGSVLVHGIARTEVARIAMQELLLTLGMSEENLTMEMGGMLIRFSIGRAVMLNLATDRFADIEFDDRLGALRINAALHNAQILMFNNGHGVVLGQSSKKIAEMAVRHWVGLLDEEGALA